VTDHAHDQAHAHEDDETAHDAHEAHGTPEDPRWVLLPLVVGLVIGIIVVAFLGLVPGAPAVV
jgi:hypothetical protein